MMQGFSLRQKAVYDGKFFAFLPRYQMGIAQGHVEVFMPHERFQLQQGDFAGLRQPTREGVPQGMEGDGVQAVAVLRSEIEGFDGMATGKQ
jgi:hypothetical protein